MPNCTNDRRTVAAPIGAEALPPLPEADEYSATRMLANGELAPRFFGATVRNFALSAIAPHVERIRVLERELAEFHQAVEDAKQTVETHRAESADIPDWRVGEFWSSANPSKKVLMLAEGAKQVEDYGQHHDFIRWVDGRTAGTAPEAAPIAWARKWHIDGEKPAKALNANNRMAWPQKFKFHAVTPHKIFRDDVPLAAAPSSLSGTEVAK